MIKLDDLASELERLKPAELAKLLKSMEALVDKTKERIMAATTEPTTEVDKPAKKQRKSLADESGDLYELKQNPKLSDELLAKTRKFLDTVDFHSHPSNRSSPDICVFGEQRYPFNAHSAAVSPCPIDTDSVPDELLKAVNELMGTNYNNILFNRYKSRNICLRVHKDDEKCIVKSTPISALSLGCTRRLKIALDEDKHKAVIELVLRPGSLLTMLPGFQEKYWHSVPEGRKSVKSERGIRYSATFRQLKVTQPITNPATDVPANEVPAMEVPATVVPATEVPATEVPATVVPVTEVPATDDTATDVVEQPNGQEDDADTHHDPALPDTFVFGSSLVKGLDKSLLSKYAKTFHVSCNRGATIGDIYEDVENVRDSGKYITSLVTTVFLVCGGNDVENIKNDDQLKDVYDDFEDLVHLLKLVFPAAKINIMSLIPRRGRYRVHISNMHKVNKWLDNFCRKNMVRFVDIFSFFLIKLPSIWELNTRLFNKGKLHFSAVGDSVLAKVLIGVANSPNVST